MSFLLDTTVLVDATRGKKAANKVAHIASLGDPIYVCAVSIEELVRGARDSEFRIIKGILNSCLIIPIEETRAWQAGVWRRDHALKGVTLSQPDCLIAASAKACRAIIATGNPKHFPMEGVTVEHWPVGE